MRLRVRHERLADGIVDIGVGFEIPVFINPDPADDLAHHLIEKVVFHGHVGCRRGRNDELPIRQCSVTWDHQGQPLVVRR